MQHKDIAILVCYDLHPVHIRTHQPIEEMAQKGRRGLWSADCGWHSVKCCTRIASFNSLSHEACLR